ncbi:MAG: acylneuraminate cytidylyltransferase family protein, partial [Anaerolineales bacterium]
MLTILAIITARGGSKSIPHKNIVTVAGKPLIAWTIETALGSILLDRVIVSTDDPEIAQVSRTLGAEVPFMRPADLAKDDTPGINPVIHAMQWLEENERYRPDYMMLLQPTSPLRMPEDINAAIDLAKDKQADSVVSVCPVHKHPYWMKQITDDGRLVDYALPERKYTYRQELPVVYALNGAIYLTRRDILLKKSSFYTKNTYAYIMPPERSMDVDTVWDLQLVDLI